MFGRIVIVALACGALLLSAVGCRKGGEKGEQPAEPQGSPVGEVGHVHAGPQVGQKAPTFSLSDSEGKSVRLADLIGKKVLSVVFWGTWCPHCRAEVPKLKEMQDAFKEKGFQIVSVAVNDTNETVRAFVKEHGINYPVLLDEKLEAAKLYDVHAVPTVIVLDRKGVIQYIGHRAEQAEATVEPLLES